MELKALQTENAPQVNITIHLTTTYENKFEVKGKYIFPNQDEPKDKPKEVSYSLPTETPLISINSNTIIYY